jgi:four helix bundle protein
MAVGIKIGAGASTVASTSAAVPEQSTERAHPPISGYRDLRVWQHAMDLVIRVYHLTSALPKSESSGLCSQLQRASVSIASRIAEGQGQENVADYLSHLAAANGALMEVETLLLMAERLAYLPASDVDPTIKQCTEIGRMLAGLVKSLKKKQ